MKKIFALMAAILLVITLSACQLEATPATTGDGASPAITLVSGKPLSYEVDATEPDWKTYFTVSDTEDGAITVTDSMISWNTTVDMTTLGSYRMQLTVTDSDGNTTTRELTIQIVADLTPPTITLVAGKVTSFVVGFTAPAWETYFVAEDDTDGAIAIVAGDITFSPALDVNTAGTYDMTVSVEDAAGNVATRTIDIIVTAS